MSPRPHTPAERIHSKLSPSGADCWLLCPGSVELTENIPDDDGNDASKDGTTAHKVLEFSIKRQVAPTTYLDKVVLNRTVTAEMCEAVEVCCDYVRDRIATSKMVYGNCWIGLELLVPLPILNVPGSDGEGHLDICLFDGETLEVIDYKNGSGVVVEVKGNPQLRLYAKGAYDYYVKQGLKPKKIRITIVQPRAPHPDGPIRHEDLTLKQLGVFCDEVKEVVAQIIGGSAPLVAGETQCRWCPAAKMGCPAFAQKSIEIAGQIFDEYIEEDGKPEAITATKPVMLTNAQLSTAMRRIDLLKMFIKTVEEAVYAKLMAGEEMPYLKLVEGKSNRRWRDPEVVKLTMESLGIEEDKYNPRSLEGIGKIEGLIPKEHRDYYMKELAEKPQGSPVIALESDPRPAMILNAADAFKDET